MSLKRYFYYALVLTGLVHWLSCHRVDKTDSTPSPNKQALENREKGNTGTSSLHLSEPLMTSYAGPCRERPGDTFTRNEGQEVCTVLLAETFSYTDPQGKLGTSCHQKSDCRPARDHLTDMSGQLIDNPLEDRTYIGGAPHVCQDLVNRWNEYCQQTSNSQTQAEQCMLGALRFKDMCISFGMLIYPHHYDCDDFAYDFNQFCEANNIQSLILSTITTEGGHALNIIEQPDGNPNDNSCLYCVAEPQDRPSMRSSTCQDNRSRPHLACWSEACTTTPNIPEHIRRQRQWEDCQTHSGFPSNAGEPPYWEFPGMTPPPPPIESKLK
jgi:hypothetical protein